MSDIEIMRIWLRMLDAAGHVLEQEITARVAGDQPKIETLQDVKNRWLEATNSPLRADETGQVSGAGGGVPVEVTQGYSSVPLTDDSPVALTAAEYKRLMRIADWADQYTRLPDGPRPGQMFYSRGQ